ncbi:lipoprotein-releasing ABC transporter permease subunit [Salinibius halmophilus]|uniref:lipoprotein-releasing ABC transporter permease subunit n=1 Tax=Salinibius halmophilus TaxID=1853216 RepID=UPI000E669079|nr:lipoprotein-releasing ABC transporter permease subunit [Salinibius halmophilus]
MSGMSVLVGLRYLRAKRQNHFVSFISAISMIGLVLGVAVLIIVLSVMNGFQREMRERVLGVVPHGTIINSDGFVQDWQPLVETALANDRVINAEPFIDANGMFAFRSRTSGALIRGIDPEFRGSEDLIRQNMLAGDISDLSAGEFNVVLGNSMASRLGASVGDKVMLMVPEVTMSIAGIQPRSKAFTVVGIFNLGAEMDSTLALTHYNDIGILLRKPRGSVDGISMQVNDLFAAREITREVARAAPGQLGTSWLIQDWTATQGTLFQAIQMEKRMIGLLLSCLILIAAFNVLSSLVMAVTDKQGDIAILRTMGAKARQIMGIFIVQGSAIGVVGVFIGTTLGIIGALTIDQIVSFVESLFGLQVLAPGVYFIDYFPSDLQWLDVLKIAGFGLLVSVLATIYPAWRASRILPSEALRYE